METVVAALPSKGKKALGGIKELSRGRIGKMSVVAKVQLLGRMSRIIGKARDSKGSRGKRRRKRMGGRLRTVIGPNKGHGGGKRDQEETPDRHPDGRQPGRKGRRIGQRQMGGDESQGEEPTFSRRSATKKAVVHEEAIARIRQQKKNTTTKWTIREIITGTA